MTKKPWKKTIFIIILCVVGLFAIGIIYFRYAEKKMTEESTSFLEEIYGQVNGTYESRVQRNWRVLNSWNDYMILTDGEDEMNADFIKRQQEEWGFDVFIYLAEDGSYCTIDGEEGTLELGEDLDRLMAGENIVKDATMEGRGLLTIMAVPIDEGSYQGFRYNAMAFCYNNESMEKLLNVDVYSGHSTCFVVNWDGDILFASNDWNEQEINLLNAMQDSAMDKSLEEIQEDWENRVTSAFRFWREDVKYYMYYQPMKFQNWVLVGVVPSDVANASLNEFMLVTILLLGGFLLLVVLALIVYLVWRSKQNVGEKELEIQFREHLFSLLTENTEDIYILFSPDTLHADYISPNIDRIIGVEPESIRNNVQNLARVLQSGTSALADEILSTIPVGGSWEIDRELLHLKTGEPRWYNEKLYHIIFEGMDKFVMILSDRMKEHQMKESLENALNTAEAANMAKSNFLANMSHDIRTPMNAIVGFTTLLAKDAEQPDKVREYTRKITSSSQHLLGLINDVLDMSKIESGKTTLTMIEFRMPELLEKINTIILPQAKAKNQIYEMKTLGEIPEVLLGDELRLNQILINLLSNAVKYTQEGGKIEFTVEGSMGSASGSVNLKFIVKDNGIGMSEEYLGKIFDPFERETNSVVNKIQGTGLGMPITKNIVELMGGTIGVESKQGEGSTFTVALEFAVSEQERDKEFWKHHSISRALVVDDEEDICTSIQELMSDTGVSVDFALNGQTAIEKVKEAHDKEENYHIILLDWRMPEMDGVETARRIRECIGSAVPILVLTAYDWSDIEEEARGAGIDAFMPKPFFLSAFQHAIRDLKGTEQEQIVDSSEEEKVMEGMLFLIAEDNEFNAEILSELLEMEGAGCERAVNGEEALQMFLKSEENHYDMVLMDVQMPVMNGYEATKAIRKCEHPRAKTIPIVAMTANAFAEDVKNALDSGMDAHIAKPVDMEILKTTLRQLKHRDS